MWLRVAGLALVISACAPAAAAAVTNTWDGSDSAAWETAGNWSEGHAPLAAEDVVIRTGMPHNPAISLANVTIHQLDTTAPVTVGPGITLTLSGGADSVIENAAIALDPTAKLVVDGGEARFIGTGAGATGGATEVKGATIAGTATFGSLSLDATSVLEEGASNTVTVAGAATLDGTLLITFLPPGGPFAGTRLPVLTYASHTGSFATVTGVTTPYALQYRDTETVIVTPDVLLTVPTTIGFGILRVGVAPVAKVVPVTNTSANLKVKLKAVAPNGFSVEAEERTLDPGATVEFHVAPTTTTPGGLGGTLMISGQGFGGAGVSLSAQVRAPLAAPAVTVAVQADSVSATIIGEGDATGFECALDSGAFVACSQPYRLFDLALGSHTLHVRQLSVDGLTSPTADVPFTIGGSGGGGGGTVSIPAMCGEVQILGATLRGTKVDVVGITSHAGGLVNIFNGPVPLVTATAAADGTFAATVAAPKGKKARKQARYAGLVVQDSSPAVRLQSGLALSKQKGGAITGTAKGKPKKVTIFRQDSCTKRTKTGTAKVKRGRFKAKLAADGAVTVYQVVARVKGGKTYTLPIIVRR